MTNDYRTGNWDGYLPDLGFVKTSSAFAFGNYHMDSYCKEFPEAPTPSPLPADVSYVFPDVTTDYFLHGLCVNGAAHASVISDDADLTYSSMDDFGNGVKLWNDANYIAKDVVGEAACEGGIFLRPSLIQRVSLLNIVFFFLLQTIQ